MPEHSHVRLNVGGSKFETSALTLSRCSMLGSMIGPDGAEGGSGVPVDEGGCIFIDRDGTHFRQILNFLRTGRLRLPQGDAEREELLEELRFYRLDPPVELPQPPSSPPSPIRQASARTDGGGRSGGESGGVSRARAVIISTPCTEEVDAGHDCAIERELRADPSLRVAGFAVSGPYCYTLISSR